MGNVVKRASLGTKSLWRLLGMAAASFALAACDHKPEPAPKLLTPTPTPTPLPTPTPTPVPTPEPTPTPALGSGKPAAPGEYK